MTTALDQVKVALAADPLYGEAYNLRGLIYASLGDAPLAEESFKRGARAQRARCRHDAQLRLVPVPAAALSRIERHVRASDLDAAISGHGADDGRAGRVPGPRRPARRGRASLVRAYELDPASPVTATNLAEVLYPARRFRARPLLHRRVNAQADVSNAQTLWLAARIENEARQSPGRCRVRLAAAPPLPGLARGAGLRAGLSSMNDAAGAAAGPLAATSAGPAPARGARAQGLHIARSPPSIKVTQKKLELLEADRFDALPDATFTRALAQTVCRALKIDPPRSWGCCRHRRATGSSRSARA
jgi:hypothetical protein